LYCTYCLAALARSYCEYCFARGCDQLDGPIRWSVKVTLLVNCRSSFFFIAPPAHPAECPR
jgi:hypothetical protein